MLPIIMGKVHKYGINRLQFEEELEDMKDN